MVEFSKLLLAEEARGLSAEGQEYLSLIVENGQKLQAMMDALLQYSRLNTRATAPVEVCLTAIMEAVVLALQPCISASRASVTADPLPRVMADPAQMRQLFEALLANALLYQPAGGVANIHIASQSNVNEAVLRITDNGIGVEPNYREVIFQHFKRLHTDEEYPGVGMGLAIARKIVERHGGTITCGANSPAGSVFTITLPTKES